MRGRVRHRRLLRCEFRPGFQAAVSMQTSNERRRSARERSAATPHGRAETARAEKTTQARDSPPQPAHAASPASLQDGEGTRAILRFQMLSRIALAILAGATLVAAAGCSQSQGTMKVLIGATTIAEPGAQPIDDS